MMRKVILLFLVALLSGCETKILMPDHDTIEALQVGDSYIAAGSEKYAYIFTREKTGDVYRNYQAFYEEFGDKSPGVAVNFVVKDKKVTAEYVAFVDATKLSAGQQEKLRDQYHATTVEPNKKLAVLFKATGYIVPRSQRPFDKQYDLQEPIRVSINEKTEQVYSWTAPLIIPIFPLYMMYGCAVGPCV